MSSPRSVLNDHSIGLHISFNEYYKLLEAKERDELRAAKEEASKAREAANTLWMGGYLCMNIGIMSYCVHQDVSNGSPALEALQKVINRTALPMITTVGSMLWASPTKVFTRQMVCWGLSAAAMTNLMLTALSDN